MKKLLSILLAVTMLALSVPFSVVHAEETDKGAPFAVYSGEGLYVHAVLDSSDTEAWQKWQSVHTPQMDTVNSSVKYFYLPSSANDAQVDVYNAFSTTAKIGNVEIAPNTTESVPYQTNRSYSVTVGGASYTLKYLRSTAEAAIYLNNPDAGASGSDLYTYLSYDKERKSTASSAIVTADGAVDNTPVSKIKGRGNTSWYKVKKGFNITYQSAVSIAGMPSNTKFSILANFQDDSLSRNRFLYDLSDAVGIPYASDSRYVDFYLDGYYWGSYLMCEKVEQGTLVKDVKKKDYLNSDGTMKDDFKFIVEVDASAAEDDYYFTASNGTKITIKSPELEPADTYYTEVREYIRQKYNQFSETAQDKNSDLSQYADIESVTKLFLINELGKNWDSGVSSTFFTYKPDESGEYKFFGSPVWDYDNSLGNALGVSSELSNIGVSDYTEYTGWWCRCKGKSKYSSSSADNIINQISVHNQVVSATPRIWFEDFLPAINHFSGEAYDGVIGQELKTAAEYYDLIYGSADMNYTSGWELIITEFTWIAPHESLRKAHYDSETKSYYTDSKTGYTQNFEGLYNYAVDWMTSRAAWISNQLKNDYTPPVTTVPPEPILIGDVNLDGEIDIIDASTVQKIAAEYFAPTAKQFTAADVNSDNNVDVIDATLIQKYIAKLSDTAEVGNITYEERQPAATAPETTSPSASQPQTTVPETTSPDNTEPVERTPIIFSNSLNWEGDIYIHYWNSETGTTWPGEKMTFYAVNEFDEDQYTFNVPQWAEYIMFNNGVGNYQSVKIPFDGSARGFYLTTDKNERGWYGYGTWNP